MASSSSSSPPPPKGGVDFSSLPWNLNLPSEHSYIHLTTHEKETWTAQEEESYRQHLMNEATATTTAAAQSTTIIKSYDANPLLLRPATTSINYGTTIWEGLKCYRVAPDKCVVFRPDQNYERMKHGATQMCLPMPSKRLFLQAIQTACQVNAHLIPPVGEGMKLYLRPLLMGTGQQLGLTPSAEFSFFLYVSPTGNYFKSATSGLNLHLETRRSRATMGGLGNVKCAGNYASTLKPLHDCKAAGFHDNLYLELETLRCHNAPDHSSSSSKKKNRLAHLNKAVLQEMSAANIFLVLRNGTIVTPSLDRGTILPGITRLSLIELIQEYGSTDPGLINAMQTSTGDDTITKVTAVADRDVLVEDLLQATEVFATGTAAEIVPIARIATADYDNADTDDDITNAGSFEMKYVTGETLPGGPVTTYLLTMLREAMRGERDLAITKRWIRDPYTSSEEFCR